MMQTRTESGLYSWPAASMSESRMLWGTPPPKKKAMVLKQQLEYKGSRPRTLPNVRGAVGRYYMFSSGEYIDRM